MAAGQTTRTISYRTDRSESVESQVEDLRTKIINQFVITTREASSSLTKSNDSKSPMKGSKSPQWGADKSPASINRSGRFA